MIHVIYGQGGWFTSFGMSALAKRLREFDDVAEWGWDYTLDIMRDMEKRKGRVALIGFSLGANAATWIASMVNRDIDLIVSYDATRLDEIRPLDKHVRRALCYQGTTPDFFGRGLLTAAKGGPLIETTRVAAPHVAIQFMERLHLKTIEAVKRMEKVS